MQIEVRRMVIRWDGRALAGKGMEKPSVVIEMFCILTWGWYAHVFVCVCVFIELFMWDLYISLWLFYTSAETIRIITPISDNP